MTTNRGPFLKLAAAAGIAVALGLMAPVSATEALGAGAQRPARMAKPVWRTVAVSTRRYEPPFVLMVGISY